MLIDLQKEWPSQIDTFAIQNSQPNQCSYWADLWVQIIGMQCPCMTNPVWADFRVPSCTSNDSPEGTIVSANKISEKKDIYDSRG